MMVAVPSPAVGRRIATALLDEHLCACVQIVGPITSHYDWQGKRQRSREWLLWIKTRSGLAAHVTRTVAALHPYEVPEIVGMPLHPVYRPYLNWLESLVPPQAPDRRRRSTRRP